MKVWIGDRYVERPMRELIIEALFVPVLLVMFVRGLSRGWGH